MYTPVNTNFTIYKWVVRGYALHGHVSMMKIQCHRAFILEIARLLPDIDVTAFILLPYDNRVKPCCVLEQGTFTHPPPPKKKKKKKVLVIPRKRWLRPNMTEKLFTGTLRINQPTNLMTKTGFRITWLIWLNVSVYFHSDVDMERF